MSPVFQRHLAPSQAMPQAQSNRARALWDLLKKNKRRAITITSGVGHDIVVARKLLASFKHGQAKITCRRKIVIYVPASDLLKGFDTWVDALTFIQDEKPASWWLDSLEPPDVENCRNGARIATSQGKPRPILSLMDQTGCDSSTVKVLCPWSIERAWERDDVTDGPKEDRVVFNDKTPRDQFIISESFSDEIMLSSLNVPVTADQSHIQAAYKVESLSPPPHPVMRHILQKETRDASAIAADRSCDMPFIMLRGKTFFVTYGWAPNNLSMSLRTDFVNLRAHAQSLGQSFAKHALDALFAKAFEITVGAIEHLIDSSTEGADDCDLKRQKLGVDKLSKQSGTAAGEYLTYVADNIVSCNRLIRWLLPKKAVFAAVDQVEWPDYISKSCRQRMESDIAVFSYLEARALSNLEQLKSLQDSCLSMINLSLSNQGMEMNLIMQKFAVVTLIMAPLTLVTGFFGMNVPIPGPSMNPDEHERCACVRRAIHLALPRVSTARFVLLGAV